MKALSEIMSMLESKGLFSGVIERGENCDIDALFTTKEMKNLNHKLVALREETKVSDIEWTSCTNFMVQVEGVSFAMARNLMEKDALGCPYHILIVKDIDAAEAAVCEFLKS